MVVAAPTPSSSPDLLLPVHAPSCTQVHNPNGALRVVVTKALPGDRWLKVRSAGCGAVGQRSAGAGLFVQECE